MVLLALRAAVGVAEEDDDLSALEHALLHLIIHRLPSAHGSTQVKPRHHVSASLEGLPHC